MFFITDAYAQAAEQSEGMTSFVSSLGMMLLIFVVFWFLLIRPQQKRQKEHKQMISALSEGDEVISAGGIIGKILAADDTYVNVQIAQVNGQPVTITFQRMAIQAVIPKGTVKF